jgi:hypothetical protein
VHATQTPTILLLDDIDRAEGYGPGPADSHRVHASVCSIQRGGAATHRAVISRTK